MSIAINLATLDIQISEDLLREDLANQHATNRPRHQLIQEQQRICGMDVERTVCECGWADEWQHQRLSKEGA